MAALLFKVGALALKTLAKPVANRFQKWALSHPTYRQRIIGIAQGFHKMEVFIARGAEGRGGKAFVGEMTEEKSMELASKLVSEGFVFFVGMVIVTFEYERSRRSEAAKKALEEQKRKAMLEQAKEERERLAYENEQQFKTIDELFQRVAQLESDLKALQEQNASKKARNSMFSGIFGVQGL